MGGIIGLDYTAVDALFRIYKVKDRAAKMNDLRVMELAALVVLNEKTKADQ